MQQTAANTGPRQDSDSLFERSPRDSDFLPDESCFPKESDVLPDESSPKDSDFFPDESSSPTDTDFLPDESSFPKDSDFLCDQSCSTKDSNCSGENSPIINEVNSSNLRSEENNITTEIPEATRFEELHYVENSYSSEENEYEFPNLRLKSPTITTVSQNYSFIPLNTERQDENVIVSESQTECRKNVELRTEETTEPCTNINEFCTPNMGVKPLETGDYIPFDIDKAKGTSLNVRLQRLRSSQVSNLHCFTSSIFEREKMKRKLPAINTFMDNQPVPSGSKDVVSPTILRDGSNHLKILARGTKETLHKIEQFQLNSSDSDDTIYELNTAAIDCERRIDVERSLPLKLQETGAKKKISKRDIQIPGPSRATDTFEDGEKSQVTNSNTRSGKQSDLTEASDKNNRALFTVENTSRVQSDERSTVVSSTRSSDGIISISDSDSNSASEDRAGSSSPRKVICEKAGTQKPRRNQPITRNFLPWEQREMVKYLVDTNCIAESRGFNVWKQMIQDGFLTHRTYQSLHNHFRRSILPHIQRFSIKRKHMRKFEKLLE